MNEFVHLREKRKKIAHRLTANDMHASKGNGNRTFNQKMSIFRNIVFVLLHLNMHTRRHYHKCIPSICVCVM